MPLFGYTLIKTAELSRLQYDQLLFKSQKAELERLREIEHEFERWADRDKQGRFVKREGEKV